MIGNHDFCIKLVPFALRERRRAVNGDFDDLVLRVIVAEDEVMLWLIDHIGKACIFQGFDNISGIVILGKVRHFHFAHGKVRCGDFLVFQTGKFCLMDRKFL